jgi:hypothetical protein
MKPIVKADDYSASSSSNPRSRNNSTSTSMNNSNSGEYYFDSVNEKTPPLVEKRERKRDKFAGALNELSESFFGPSKKNKMKIEAVFGITSSLYLFS